MSAGAFVPEIYTSDGGFPYPVRVQPETLSLTLNTTVNLGGLGPVAPNTPSARISGSNRELGVICRRVRFKFSTATIPPGYKPDSILTLPVFTLATYNAYGKNTVGTYTVGGTAYDIAFVGKSPERIN